MSDIFRSYRRWFVLLGLMLTYAATNGIIVHTLPLIYPSLIDEFGWTATQITLPATVFYVFGAISSPPAGVLLDRFSPRTVMLCGASGIILSLFFLGVAQTLWQMVVIYFCFGIFLSLCGLAASMVILTRWFRGLHGRATGFLLMSSSVGGALFPLILGFGTESFGWRASIFIIVVIAALMMLPSLLFLVLDEAVSKEHISREEGAPLTSQPGVNGNTTTLAVGPTLRQALQSPAFYLIAFSTASVWFCVVALLQHQSIYLVQDIGVNRSLLPKVFSVFFACSILGKLSFGLLSDYLNKEISMILSIATFVCGLLILRQIGPDDSALLFVYAAIAGIGFSGSFTTIQVLIAQHFSGNSYGKILAILVMIDSLAGGLGTRVIAIMRDNAESYQSAFNLMITICILAISCLFFIKRPSSFLSSVFVKTTNLK